MSVSGTELPIPNVRSSVANGGKADKICSMWVLRILTRCGLKPVRNAVAHQSPAAPDVLSWREERDWSNSREAEMPRVTPRSLLGSATSLVGCCACGPEFIQNTSALAQCALLNRLDPIEICLESSRQVSARPSKMRYGCRSCRPLA